MKGALAAVVVLLAACSQNSSGAPAPSPESSGAHAVVSSDTAAPSPASSSPLAVVVGRTPGTTHSVYLVEVDGHVLASVTAANQTAITSWPQPSPILSLWSTYATASDTRAYYLDGDTTVRYMDRAGKTGDVIQVPGDARKRSFFAVSPDDGQIAVSVLDYSAPPIVQMQFYVQDLKSGSKSMIPTAASLYFWPIGWHSGNIVVQVGQPIPQTLYGAYPEGAADFQVIDPKTGSSLATVGGPSCAPMPSLATPIGVVCAGAGVGRFEVVGWDGKALSFTGPLGTEGASLSTDGRWVATSSAKIVLTGSPAAASQQVQTAADGYPGEAGWIDSTHFIYRLANSSNEAIYDVTLKSITALQVDGSVVGRIPGGL